MWRNGTFLDKPQVRECATYHNHRSQSHRVPAQHQVSLGDISPVQKSVPQLHRQNAPLLSTQHPGTSLHVINFTRTSCEICKRQTLGQKPGYKTRYRTFRSEFCTILLMAQEQYFHTNAVASLLTMEQGWPSRLVGMQEM